MQNCHPTPYGLFDLSRYATFRSCQSIKGNRILTEAGHELYTDCRFTADFPPFRAGDTFAFIEVNWWVPSLTAYNPLPDDDAMAGREYPLLAQLGLPSDELKTLDADWAIPAARTADPPASWWAKIWHFLPF